MQITEQTIKQLVEEVMKKMDHPVNEKLTLTFGQGVFSTVDEAVNAAKQANEKMKKIPLGTRKKMIEEMRRVSLEHATELAEMAVQETGLGRVEDKIAKNELAANKTPGVEDLPSTSYSGENGLTIVEQAPIGIIGSITPTTNPAATIINNSISMVAAGNVVVYNPHPSAKKVSITAMQLLNEAIVAAGGPENVLTSVNEPTIDTSQELMNHPRINALVVTGGGAVVRAAMSTGKKVIAAGPGNPPVVVDETANLKKAAKDIVFGASFDNNILCTAEKELFVVQQVAQELKTEMLKNNTIELKSYQLDKLLEVILVKKNGKYYANKDFIGKDASVLLQAAGMHADPSTRLIIVETSYEHPLVHTEMLMPILPIVKVSSVEEAIRLAKEAEKGNRHTAMMHSESITNLTKMAQAIEATIFVKNGPSLAGLGYKSEGFTTLTIAGPTGEGLTSARTFTRQRRSVVVDGLRII